MRPNSSPRAVLDLFKRAMGRLGTPAMILTSALDCSKGACDPSHLHGMTLSSVSLLSVCPRPLLLFNLHLPSHTLVELHRKQHMAIHILPPTPQLARLGRAFASGTKARSVPDDGELFHERTTPFLGLVHGKDWTEHFISEDTCVPILCEAECTMICETIDSVFIDNHEVWIAHVLQVLDRNGPGSDKGGLLYFNRAFHMVGAPIKSCK